MVVRSYKTRTINNYVNRRDEDLRGLGTGGNGARPTFKRHSASTVRTQLGERRKLPPIIQYVVVAGGGGGAGGTGAGGGAGGLRYGQVEVLPRVTYSLTVGGGGAGNTADGGNGATGSPSTFALNGVGVVPKTGWSILSSGGGGGNHGYPTTFFPGGSGGGSGYVNAPNGLILGGSNVSYVANVLAGEQSFRQGWPGGAAQNTGSPSFAAAGGGGAGGPGGNAISTVDGGWGGIGIPNPIVGSIIGQANLQFGSYWLAGGGAGATNGVLARGGLGGGGQSVNDQNGTAGNVNTGGGGAAAGTSAPTDGGNGGSGVIIISYPSAYANIATITGLTSARTESNGNIIYSFTAGTGTISWN